MASYSYITKKNIPRNQDDATLTDKEKLDLETGAQLISFNGRTAVVVRAKTWDGKEFLDVRKMLVMRDEAGDLLCNPENGRIRLIYTKKGITVRKEEVDKLVSVLRQMLQISCSAT